jgi:hypothetical protein
LDDFVRKPFRATPVPATTYKQPTALLAKRPLSRPLVSKVAANEKSESDQVSPFRAKPVPASTYKQPKERQHLSATKEAKKDTSPVVSTKTCVADVPISVTADVLATTTENQDLPVVVKPDLAVDVVVPSIAGNDQHPLVITEPECDISTKGQTCLEDDDDDDACWGMMGDWTLDLDEKPDEEELRQFELLETPVEPPAISDRRSFKLKQRQYTTPELATIWEENEDMSPDNQHHDEVLPSYERPNKAEWTECKKRRLRKRANESAEKDAPLAKKFEDFWQAITPELLQ